jgi:hypothetical protein
MRKQVLGTAQHSSPAATGLQNNRQTLRDSVHPTKRMLPTTCSKGHNVARLQAYMLQPTKLNPTLQVPKAHNLMSATKHALASWHIWWGMYPPSAPPPPPPPISPTTVTTSTTTTTAETTSSNRPPDTLLL